MVRIAFPLVGDDLLKHTLAEVLQLRDGLWMAEQTLRRHHHQGLADFTHHLATQGVEELRWRGQVHDHDVVFCCERQKSLEARRAVLGALAFKAMR